MVDSSLNMTLGQGIDLPRVDPALDYQKREMEQTMVLKDREVEQALVLQDREVEQAMVLQNMEWESEGVAGSACPYSGYFCYYFGKCIDERAANID